MHAQPAGVAVEPDASHVPAPGGRRTIAALLFGHDYFLSYCRQDGARYAAHLAGALERRGLVVCFDRTDFEPGGSLSRTLARRVRRSHRLLLIDTTQARQSKYVAEEIAHAVRGRRPIVRITGAASGEVGWRYVDPEQIGLDDIIRLEERGDIAADVPSEGVVADVVRTARRTRSLRRLTAALVVFLCVVGALAYAAWRLRETGRSRQLAAEATRLLDTAPGEALALAVQAAELAETDESRRALSRALAVQRLGFELPDSTHSRYARFSADGSAVVSVGIDGSPRVWDARSGAGPLTLEDIEIAASSEDPGSTIWPADRGARLFELCRRSWLPLPGLSADCSRIVTNSRVRFSSRVRVWDVISGRRLMELPDHVALIEGWFSPVGPIVVVGPDAAMRVWDAATNVAGPTLEACPVGAGERAAMSADGARLVAAGDGGACVWDVRTGMRQLVLDGHTARLTDAQFSFDGSLIVTSSEDGTARVWKADTGAPTMVLTGHSAPVTHAEFSADGLRIITSSGDEARYPPDGPTEGLLESHDPRARVWSADTSALLYELLAGADEDIVRYAAFSPDGRAVVTAGDGPVRVWTNDGRQWERVPAEAAAVAVVDATISPDGGRIIDGSSVRPAGGGDAIFTIEGPGEPMAAAFSADGSQIIAVFPSLIALLDARTGTTLTTIEFEDIDELDRATISPDRRRVAGTHTYYTKTTLWDLRDGREKVVDGSAEAWSPEGQSIVTIFERARSAILWDAQTGGMGPRFPGGSLGVSDAGFSPDGSMVVTVDGNGVTRIWDARTGRELDSLPRHTGQVGAVFSADGSFVRVTGGDGTVSAYPLRFNDLLELARARLRR